MTILRLIRFVLRFAISIALLLDYVREMNALAEKPRWYNALTHNCTTTIWHHQKAVGVARSFDWRLLCLRDLMSFSEADLGSGICPGRRAT